MIQRITKHEQPVDSTTLIRLVHYCQYTSPHPCRYLTSYTAGLALDHWFSCLMRLSHDETRNPIHPEYVIWHTENYLDCHLNRGHNSMFSTFTAQPNTSFITIDHKTSRIRPILVKNAEHWRLAKFCSSKLYRLSDRLNISTVVFSGDGIDRKIDTTLRICGLVEGGGWGGNAQKCVSLEARMNKKRYKDSLMFSSVQNNDELRDMSLYWCVLQERIVTSWYASMVCTKMHIKGGIRYFRSATYFFRNEYI